MIKRYFFLVGILISCISIENIAKNNNNQPSRIYTLPKGATENDYLAKTIVFKVNQNLRNQCFLNTIVDTDIQNTLQELGVHKLNLMFPFSSVPDKIYNEQGRPYADLSLIYQLTYTADINIEEAINKMLATNKLKYAEPKYIHQLRYTVNDPSASTQQTYLNKIKAYNAWDISVGDTNVVIGIVDSGTDIDHPDLVGNIKYNYNDPINGIDDDNDGYIDNFRGWDISENDNNPNIDNSAHGSHVSGCAAASTNNGIGVASPGFNCKFLPVKCAAQSSTTTIDSGYEGITYAADHGCKIINCSWGGSFYTDLGQDVINYATINKDALVIASAGNDNVDAPSYPAAFQYVTSVAATTISDKKATFSNYNYTVDVSAPGNNIYSTVYNNSYTSMSGTSMASPVAAGAAAIIRSHFPSFNALQAGEQLRISCDDIYTGIPSNNGFIGRLGKGRINMEQSLSLSLPSVRMEPILFTDGNDNAFVAGDTISISGDFINYLMPTNNCIVTLTAITNTSSVSIINSNFTIGALNTLGVINNNNSPFKVVINPSAPANTTVLFNLAYNDGSTYTDFQTFEIIVNVDYINVTINDAYTTITSKGRICYNADSQNQGLGFVYKDSSLVYECGLMLGTSSSKVVNTIRGTAAAGDEDFTSVSRVSIDDPMLISDFDLSGIFNDSNAPTSNKLGVTVKHRSFAWSSVGDRNYVIVQYNIKNTSNGVLNNLYAGIFTDWDINDYSANRSEQNPNFKLGYSYSTSNQGFYGGVKLLSNTPFNFYAVDNISGGGGGVNLYDGYSLSEKYQTLSTSRLHAGTNGLGNDVINIVSTGPFNLAQNDSVIVAFALIGGEDLNDLETGAANAQIKYNSAFPEITTLVQHYSSDANFAVWPNPAQNNINIQIALEQNEIVQIELYDVNSKLVKLIDYGKYNAGLHTISLSTENIQAGLYYCKVISQDKIYTHKISLIK
ncbi:MAG: S8 family peptidase [Bacteroidia bacterium]|nr:S8 family peptidase [Bacteroidia bacterium]MCZ2248313.1 S8 family peptidase [Bacteroidia bacterium]